MELTRNEQLIKDRLVKIQVYLKSRMDIISDRIQELSESGDDTAYSELKELKSEFDSLSDMANDDIDIATQALEYISNKKSLKHGDICIDDTIINIPTVNSWLQHKLNIIHGLQMNGIFDQDHMQYTYSLDKNAFDHTLKNIKIYSDGNT